ncbi:DUF6517 family protein [Natrialbaceae archaeon A-CW3]
MDEHPSRRHVLATTSAAALAATAGCVGDLLDDATTFSASPAEVSGSAQSETGYDHRETDSFTEEREVAGETVEVTNYLAEYTRSLEVSALGGSYEAAVFATICSPQVSVAGQDFNPLAEMDTREIIRLVQEQYEDMQIGDRINERSVDGLEQTLTVESYEGQARLVGEGEIDVCFDVSTPDHGGDHLVLIAVYPNGGEGGIDVLPDEADRVDTLLSNLEHGDD